MRNTKLVGTFLLLTRGLLPQYSDVTITPAEGKPGQELNV
jgi:hypothetical protein